MYAVFPTFIFLIVSIILGLLINLKFIPIKERFNNLTYVHILSADEVTLKSYQKEMGEIEYSDIKVHMLLFVLAYSSIIYIFISFICDSLLGIDSIKELGIILLIPSLVYGSKRCFKAFNSFLNGLPLLLLLIFLKIPAVVMVYLIYIGLISFYEGWQHGGYNTFLGRKLLNEYQHGKDLLTKEKLSENKKNLNLYLGIYQTILPFIAAYQITSILYQITNGFQISDSSSIIDFFFDLLTGPIFTILSITPIFIYGFYKVIELAQIELVEPLLLGWQLNRKTRKKLSKIPINFKLAYKDIFLSTIKETHGFYAFTTIVSIEIAVLYFEAKIMSTQLSQYAENLIIFISMTTFLYFLAFLIRFVTVGMADRDYQKKLIEELSEYQDRLNIGLLLYYYSPKNQYNYYSKDEIVQLEQEWNRARDMYYKEDFSSFKIEGQSLLDDILKIIFFLKFREYPLDVTEVIDKLSEEESIKKKIKNLTSLKYLDTYRTDTDKLFIIIKILFDEMKELDETYIPYEPMFW